MSLWLQERNLLKRIHQETFGKSGCRRIVPGQMLATDPKGRACMIAAVEKQKVLSLQLDHMPAVGLHY